jgi:hypothetical protein
MTRLVLQRYRFPDSTATVRIPESAIGKGQHEHKSIAVVESLEMQIPQELKQSIRLKCAEAIDKLIRVLLVASSCHDIFHEFCTPTTTSQSAMI